jgi:hypothetical protein
MEDAIQRGPNQRDFLLAGTALGATGEFRARRLPLLDGGHSVRREVAQFRDGHDLQPTLTDPALKLPTPHVVNLTVDPKQRKPIDLPYIHSSTAAHFGSILKEFAASAKREPLIPAGAPLDHTPVRKT